MTGLRSRDEDLALLQGCFSGSPSSWEVFLARYGGRIESACRWALLQAGLPSGPDEVADAAGEVFASLLAGDCRILRRYRPGTSLGAFLGVVAGRRALDLARRRRPAAAPWLPEPSEAEDPAALAEAAELAERLEEALAGLPPRDAEILRLFHLEGLSYPEVAGRMGIPDAQVGVALLRARERLRAALGRDFVDFP